MFDCLEIIDGLDNLIDCHHYFNILQSLVHVLVCQRTFVEYFEIVNVILFYQTGGDKRRGAIAGFLSVNSLYNAPGKIHMRPKDVLSYIRLTFYPTLYRHLLVCPVYK